MFNEAHAAAQRHMPIHRYLRGARSVRRGQQAADRVDQQVRINRHRQELPHSLGVLAVLREGDKET